MKKLYQLPEMKILVSDEDDILTTSGPNTLNDNESGYASASKSFAQAYAEQHGSNS